MTGPYISLFSYCSRVIRNFYTLEIDLGAKKQSLNSIANSCLSYSQYFAGKTTVKYVDGNFHTIPQEAEPQLLANTTKKISFIFYGIIAIPALPIGTIARIFSCLFSGEVRKAIFTDLPQQVEPRPPAFHLAGTTEVPSTLSLIQQVAISLADKSKSTDTGVDVFKGPLDALLTDAIAFFDKLISIKSDREKSIWLQTQIEYLYPFFLSLVLLSKELENSLNPTLLRRLKIQHNLSLNFLEQLRLTPLLKKVPPGTSKKVVDWVHSQKEYFSTRDARLRDALLQTPCFNLFFQFAPIFTKYKDKIVPFLRKFWDDQLALIKEFNHETQSEKKKKLTNSILKKIKTPTLFGLHFTSELNTVFELHAPFLEPSFVQEYREAYLICTGRMKILPPCQEAANRSEIQILVERIKASPIKTDFFNEIIQFFEEFEKVPDDECESWLAEKTQQHDYSYPFSNSENIFRDLESFEKAFGTEICKKWKQLYLDAQRKLIRVGLAKYLDEARPTLVKQLEIELEQLIQQFQSLSPASRS